MATAKKRGPTTTGPASSALTEYRRKRDFTKTAEPAGGSAKRVGTLRYVIQKHDATNLHFDLRLELDGVMKSWAVPKGPSLDPTVKRLAMQVEDHPIEYNEFEGTIPKGEYGGGTVMIWDRGTYSADDAMGGDLDEEEAIRRVYAKGDLKFVLHGERLQGSWVLVRTRYSQARSAAKPSWLLIKHRDQYARPGSDVVAEFMTSVVTGRTMEEIAAGAPLHRGKGEVPRKNVWSSNRATDMSGDGKPPGRARAAGTKGARNENAPRRSVATGAATNSAKKSATKTAAKRPPSNSSRKTAKTAVAKAPRRARHVVGGAELELPALSFPLTNLEKVFFPKVGYTKGDLLRYYARVAAEILPVTKDRPLALKRYPNGVGGKFFFQQNAPASSEVLSGVRVEPVKVGSDGEAHPRFIGGSLATLLYTIQLGCIGVDPWHSHLPTLATPDYAVIDLDPGDKVPFRGIVDVARWVHDALDELGLRGAPKTSGSRGIHIYIPLPPRTTDAMAVRLAERVATAVVVAHPQHATVERQLKRRGPTTVYVDYLQNARGKTVAAAYAVRAVEDARVSMPLRWSELTPRLDPHDFTLATAPARIAEVGDVWAEGMAERNSVAAVRAAAASGDEVTR